MTSWKAGDIEVNGIRIHYTRTGGDSTPGGSPAKPTLVLAHGVTDDGLCWTPVAQALESEYDVIMVDARGHGQSEAPATGYEPLTQAADLQGVITGLGLHKPVVLGHSMGAITTLVLAAAYPDIPHAILLEDPPGWWVASSAPAESEDRIRGAEQIYGHDPRTEGRLSGMQAWFAGLKHKTREELIAEQRGAAPSWSEAELGPWADSKLRVSPHVLSVLKPVRSWSLDWAALLPHITCPALVITAEGVHGAALTADGAAALRSLVPQLQIEHIAGAGHNIRREQFEHFMAVVRTFLGEVAAGREAATR